MKKTVFAVMAGILVCSSAAQAQNELGPTHHINFKSGLTIDGNLSDWTNAEWITYNSSTVGETGGSDFGGTPDTTTRFSTMYDNDAMYFAAEVTDDFISYSIDTTVDWQWWTRDGVQWFIDFTGNPFQEVLDFPDVFIEEENITGQKYLPGEFIVAIGATEDQTDLGTLRWPVGTRGGNRSDSYETTYEDGTVTNGERNPQWQVVCNINGANYTIEARVPFASLETSPFFSDPEDTDLFLTEELRQYGWQLLKPTPLAGSTILLTHLTIDTDLPDGGYDSQVMWVGDGDMDINWTEAIFMAPTDVVDWDLR